MYRKNPQIEQPEGSQTIWRYMDLKKFISLLAKKSLYFINPHHFNDKFEGTYPLPNITEREELYRDYPEHIRHQFVYVLPQVSKTFERNIYVNCWHMNDDESFAMWKIYSIRGEGVAIKTTFEKLCASFAPEERQVSIGKVKYLDYKTEPIPENNAFQRYLWRPHYFSYENEIRALVFLPQRINYKVDKHGRLIPGTEQLEPNPKGIFVKVDLDILINEIYVSPTAGSTLKSVVRDLLIRYGLKRDLLQSDLTIHGK